MLSNRFDLGCAGAAWTQERLTSPGFLLTAPIQVTAAVGLTMKSTGIKTWADTAGKRMGGVRGEVYLEDGGKMLKDLADKTEFPGPQEGLLALTNSQVDFLMMNLVQATYFLKNAPAEGLSSRSIAEPLKVYPESLCVNGNEPDLLTAVNILLGNYRADGSYAKTRERIRPRTPICWIACRRSATERHDLTGVGGSGSWTFTSKSFGSCGRRWPGEPSTPSFSRWRCWRRAPPAGSRSPPGFNSRRPWLRRTPRGVELGGAGHAAADAPFRRLHGTAADRNHAAAVRARRRPA